LAYKEALSSYELQTGALPTTEQGLQVLWEKPSIPPVPDEWQKIMTGEILDPWGNPYQYRNPGRHNPKGYDVFSMGPDGVAGTLDDIGNWPRLNNHGTP
jgi:general secretion pathway protein G